MQGVGVAFGELGELDVGERHVVQRNIVLAHQSTHPARMSYCTNAAEVS